jgi:uncharacterized membrane protein YeaQ/YmgE (transglycosylase-associated protein family)
MSTIIGWICIGLAAAFGAWIWPFRRGYVGLALNAGLGVVGAIGAAFLAVALGVMRSSREPAGLAVAALGALAALVIAHLVWSAVNPPRRHAHVER